MKKIMFALAVAVTAVAAQAASVDWSASKIYVGDDSTAQASDYAVYLFVDQTYSATTLAGELAGGNTASLVAANYEAVSTAATVRDGTTYTSSLANGGYDAYMVVFNNSDPTQATKFYMTDVGDTDLVISGAGDMVDFEKLGNRYASAWTAVGGGSDPAIPEPTSGLLMLVGLGALALRRRR